MIAIWGTALAISVIAACVGPLFYCRDSSQDQGDATIERSETIETESPLVHIKISRPKRDQFSDDASTPGAYGGRRNSGESADIKEAKSSVPENEPVSTDEAQMVPVKPFCEGTRMVSGIWSSEFRNQLHNITNSSSEMGGSTRMVRAQIEANPMVSGSSNQETVDSVGSKSRRDLTVLNSHRSNLSVERARRVSSVIRRWRNLKKTLASSRSEKSALKKNETDETQRLTIPRTISCHRSPMGHSTMLRKSRLVDASTSTRISYNLLDARGRSDELTRHDNCYRKDESPSIQSENDRFYSNTERYKEMVSLVKRPSTNGKSVCDIRITGLKMSQSELLDLFEATRNKTRSATIVTTEEASIISIKFDRRKNDGKNDRTRQNLSYKSPIERFYKSLPDKIEDLLFFRLFRSQSDTRSHSTPSVQIPDRSRNETSYMAIPNLEKKLTANESVYFERKTSMRRRINNNRASRFIDERQI